MRIAIIGYGKMGKTIEQIAQSKGHEISYRINHENQDLLQELSPETTDVAIEFTQPEAAVSNISLCLQQGVPVVSGTTGWLEHYDTITALCKEKKGAFFYASNFSVGVNLFFIINERVAKLMQGYPDYNVELQETHHTEKKDSPSGTAITLAEGIMQTYTDKSTWINAAAISPDQLSIMSFREEGVPGTHQISYQSSIDTIELKHTAHSREGFAGGAVMAAEWLAGKEGVFGMRDLLGLEA